MDRRRFLAASGGAIALALGGCSLVPVFPQRPDPDPEAALGWIRHRAGRFTLILPRAEIGQNIATALKQVACQELGVDWDRVELRLHGTDDIARVRATVGSESVRLFAEPLAQACATLRDALAAGHAGGALAAAPRPRDRLRAFGNGAHVGRSPRPEQHLAIVTGQPLFAADMSAEGVAYGRVLRFEGSPEADSRPRRWNAAAAAAEPGFVAIVEDALLRLGGSFGLGIVAATPGALNRIEKALEVEWLVEPAPQPPPLAEIVDIDRVAAGGGLDHALAGDRIDGSRPWDIDLRLDIAAAPHGGIEPRAALAVPAGDGGMEVWTGSQDLFYVRDVLARGLGLAEDRVRVHGCRVGGAFGGRTICTVEAEAAALARAAGRPVKVQWSRARELSHGFHRPPSSHRLRLRLERGRVADWQHGLVSSHILFTNAAAPRWLQLMTDTFVGDGGVARGARPPYRTARLRIDYGLRRLPVFTGPWRGLGGGPNALAVESAIDEAAHAAGQDPLAFRIAHAADPRLAAVLDAVRRLARWGDAATPLAGHRTGRGVGCGIYKEASYAAAVADVAVAPDGTVRVTRMWCAHDCGLVINPDQVRAQCEGNLVWGLAMVLLDELPVRAGAVAAESFAEAPIPRIADVPPIAVALLPSGEAPAGAGETAIVAAPGAVANAVRAATGIRPRRFPLRPGDFAA